MVCPNKNDKNWKILVNALGEDQAYMVFSSLGVPDIANNPTFNNLLGKVNDETAVLQALQDIANPEDNLTSEVKGLNSLLNLRKLEISRLDSEITTARKNNNFVQADQLSEKKDSLLGQLEELKKKINFEKLIEEGQSDLNKLRNAIDSGKLGSSQIDLGIKTASLWMESTNMFLTKEDKADLPEVEKEFAYIASRASDIREELEKAVEKNVEKFARKYVGQDFWSRISEDISGMKKRFLDISHINDSFISAMYQSVKEANTRGRNEAVAISKKLETLFKPLKDRYGADEVHEKLKQKYDDGTDTGGLITKIKPEYQEKKYNLRREMYSYKGKDDVKYKLARKKYNEFIQENEIVFDVRKLFGEMKGREEHVAELKAVLGEAEYNRRFKLLTQKLKNYKTELENRKVQYEAEYSEEIAKEKLEEWDLANSPFLYMEYIENVKDPKFKDVYQKGYEYTYSVPSKTEWYDSRFTEIENDSELFEYYSYVMSTLKNLSTFLPESKRREVKSNSIPFIEKDILTKFNEKGFKAASAEYLENFMKSLRTKDGSTTFRGYQDPVTGEEDHYLKPPAVEDNSKILDLFNEKLVQYKAEFGVPALGDQRNKLYREARQEIANAKSFNINSVIEAYALMSHSYFQKSRIEDQIRLIKFDLDNKTEIEKRNNEIVRLEDGSPKLKSQTEAFKEAKDAVSSFLDTAFYEKGRKDQFLGKKKTYTKQEQAKKEEYEELLENENLSEKDKGLIQEKIDSLGGVQARSRYLDNILKWIQLKGMGWNVPAGIVNLGFGKISNWIHAAGGEDFSMKDLTKGEVLALNTLVGKMSDNGSKLIALMEKFDVLKDSSNELGKVTMNKKLGALSPYWINNRTEFMNQAPILAAMMMKNGMWEKFDKDGNYSGGPDFYNSTEFFKFKARVDQVIKSLHGNYDPDSPIQIKEDVLGRMATQFRTWLFESVYNRFGGKEYDPVLERVKMGRYGAILPFIKDLENIIKGKTTLEPHEIAAMRKNAAELIALLGITSVVLMLRAGEDDDEDKARITNFVINSLTRLQTDITFYVDPSSAMTILKQPIPAASIITDTTQLLGAVYKLMRGDDEIESGVFAGDSRVTREIMQTFPVTNQAYRIYSSGEQIFKK